MGIRFFKILFPRGIGALWYTCWHRFSCLDGPPKGGVNLTDSSFIYHSGCKNLTVGRIEGTGKMCMQVLCPQGSIHIRGTVIPVRVVGSKNHLCNLPVGNDIVLAQVHQQLLAVALDEVFEFRFWIGGCLKYF